jgi:hypothetical protein
LEKQSTIASSVNDFKAFADNNKQLIEKLKHIRFYTTMLLKDMLTDEYKEEEI